MGAVPQSLTETTMRKLPIAQRRIRQERLRRGIERLLGTPAECTQYHARWTAPAEGIGTAKITLFTSDVDSSIASIYIRLSDGPKALATLGAERDLNRFSGKWNIHYDTAEDALNELDRRLSRILPVTEPRTTLQAMSNYKHNCTKGPVNIAAIDQDSDHIEVFAGVSDGPQIAVAKGTSHTIDKDAYYTGIANATLIAEAFNVLAETGMTPRELADLLDRLAELLADIQNRNDDRPRELTHGEYDDLCAIVTSYEQAEP